jgi:hypothetical protein
VLVAGAGADSLLCQIPQPPLHIRGLNLRRQFPHVVEEGKDDPLLVSQQVGVALALRGRGRGPERDGTPQNYLEVGLSRYEGSFKGFLIHITTLTQWIHN